VADGGACSHPGWGRTKDCLPGSTSPLTYSAMCWLYYGDADRVGLLSEINQGSTRISSWSKRLRTTTWIRPRCKRVDVHLGARCTLPTTHKLKQGVVVTREYDLSLPPICAYGSELNQVWTNRLTTRLMRWVDRPSLGAHVSRAIALW